MTKDNELKEWMKFGIEDVGLSIRFYELLLNDEIGAFWNFRIYLNSEC